MAIVTRTENINRFFNDIRKFDTLSKYDEQTLFEEYKNGNEQAKDKICNPNLKWIVSRAKAYSTNPDKVQDLIQEGAMGMLDAFTRYEPAKGYKFFSYANYYIDMYMRNFLFGNNLVRQTNDRKLGLMLKRIVNQFFAINQRYPIEYEVVDILETEYQIKVKDLRDIMPMGFSYIDGFVTEDEDSESVGECGEFASKTASRNAYEVEMDKEEETFSVAKYLKCLTDKEKNIVVKSFGLFGETPKEDSEIGEEVGLTSERVRQIRKGAILKMKKIA